MVIVTDQDHEANSTPGTRFDRGMVIREWHVDPESGQLKLDALATLTGS